MTVSCLFQLRSCLHSLAHGPFFHLKARPWDLCSCHHNSSELDTPASLFQNLSDSIGHTQVTQENFPVSNP